MTVPEAPEGPAASCQAMPAAVPVPTLAEVKCSASMTTCPAASANAPTFDPPLQPGDTRMLVQYACIPGTKLSRSIIHSRLGAGLERYKTAYPRTDILLFEPNRADADMFFTNLFSYSSRRRLCEHAYQKTREELWKRRHELAPKLEQHGIAPDVIDVTPSDTW